MNQIVEILLPNALDHGFDYRAPEGVSLRIGDIVRVPIGSRESLGVVWGEGKFALKAEKYKTIIGRMDEFPTLSPAFLSLIKWVAWYNAAPIGAILKMVLPVADAEVHGRKSLDSYIPTIDVSAIKLMPLAGDQLTVANDLKEKLSQGFSVSLLDGVTGSGKTEVYFDVIADILRTEPSARKAASHVSDSCRDSGDKQVLVLLPEIALSVQWLGRFEARFGVKPVVWNSTITAAKRRATFQAIATGKARVIIGARSALFLPYTNLSLIIADEEHDSSYKQEEGVIYHARDMAIARASHEKFPVILVSATPSLETVHNAKTGKYTELTLHSRHAEAVLPDIHLLDMRSESLDRGNFISRTLRDAVAKAVEQGHQAMLFLNRRGYAPLVLCRKCGHRFQCPDCSAWMVQHGGMRDEGLGTKKTGKTINPQSPTPNSYLKCHHCAYTIPVPKACPSCGAEDSLHACGPGVERVHEEIAAYLPNARVATLASDSTGSYRELSTLIRGMENKEIDILIGTQMIAKGHHFADLSVVGVIDADLGLAGGDLRAAEKTYQLLHQISGRAGRESVRGHVYLQSYTPEHAVMQALVSGKRDAFFAAELRAREQADMPPFSRLAALIIEGKNENAVVALCKQLSQMARNESHITIMGPAPAPLFMLRGQYRYRFLLKAGRKVNLPDFVKQWVAAANPPRTIKVRVDIDPVSFL